MTGVIELVGLTKHYGDARALDGVDLTVPEGAVFGFLGPNGAGKTTTLRILNGLAHATSGDARIFGDPAGSREARAATGFLPDVPGYYEWMRADEFLHFTASLFGVERAVATERVKVLLEMAGLAGVSTRIGGFSRGMKQRLGVAQALVNAPRLLMLDEPTSALDPVGRRDILEMIRSLRGRTTVFFSTHILGDVERVCDTVAVLANGRVVAQGSLDQLTAGHTAHRIALAVEGDDGRLVDALHDAPWVRAVEREGEALSVSVTDPEVAGRETPALLARLGIGLRRFEPAEASLEDVFMDLVGGHAGRDTRERSS